MKFPTETAPPDRFEVVEEVVPDPVENNRIFAGKRDDATGVGDGTEGENPGLVLFIAEHLSKVRLKFSPSVHRQRTAYHRTDREGDL